MAKLKNISELGTLIKSIREKNRQFKMSVTICGGTGCRANESEALKDAFESELRSRELDKQVKITFSGCHGFCELGPLVVIKPEGILYCQVKEKDVEKIVSETLIEGKIIDSLLFEDPVTGEKTVYEKDIPFYKAQKRLILSQNGSIDPTIIEDYLANGGYKALGKVLTEMTPDEVINEIKESGLRGRGGAGFPTGRKWESCRQADGDIKYIICNCDEGDPGAYMDRSVLEGNPHLVLEGMIIGAYTIGAQEGYIYVRHEYPWAWKNAEVAINQARKLGLLGKNIPVSYTHLTLPTN